MTSDPGSILADQGRDTGPLVAQLALQLIRNARDQGVVFRDRPKERKESKSSEVQGDVAVGSTPVISLSSGTDATLTLSRALGNQLDALRKPKSKAKTMPTSLISSPIFGSFLSQQTRKSSNAVDKTLGGHHEPASSSSPGQGISNTNVLPASSVITRKAAASVPLESIIPATAKPPTQYLSRTYTPLTSREFRFSLPFASRFTVYHDDKNQRPLTDAYGFMYDVSQYDVLLLLRAKECGNTAPACLTEVRIADREEDNSWPDEDEEDEGEANGGKDVMEIVKGMCTCDGEGTIPISSPRPSLSTPFTSTDSQSVSTGTKSRSSSKSRKRSSTITSSAMAPSVITSVTSILSVTSDTPRHACANTVRKLLDQLTEMHDQCQKTRRKEWDAFVKHRSKVKTPKSHPTSSAAALGGGGAAAILGLGTALEDDELSHSEGLIGFAQLGLSANRDERREFDRLVRGGIPLVFRSKVWLECCGGLEMREPGVFRDLLAEEEGPGGVVGEIEKDVGRTMPLNLFFGGDGAGVDKLRRVLIAYSRWVL